MCVCACVWRWREKTKAEKDKQKLRQNVNKNSPNTKDSICVMRFFIRNTKGGYSKKKKEARYNLRARVEEPP